MINQTMLCRLHQICYAESRQADLDDGPFPEWGQGVRGLPKAGRGDVKWL